MIIPNHWHFQIAAFEKIDKEKGIMYGMSIVEVIDCDTEEEAMKRVKQKIKRNGYFLQKAWQCSHCLASLRQNETAERLTKVMKQQLE